jgi:hypothetical protein
MVGQYMSIFLNGLRHLGIFLQLLSYYEKSCLPAMHPEDTENLCRIFRIRPIAKRNVDGIMTGADMSTALIQATPIMNQCIQDSI